MIMDIVKKHNASTSEDMLQTIMKGAMNGELGSSSIDKVIVDNCKDVYIPGFEVSGVVAIWGLMLLASHPEWQARVRTEVQEVCGDQLPDANMLGRMRVVCNTLY
jgi:cytochrome P450